jgi:hypothetical protein
MPRLVQAAAHNAEVNCAPLSVVTVAGTPKHATQLAMKASVHVLASMLRRRTASTHLVDLSMMVNRYTWPPEEAGRGPTRSTCTWEKCACRHRDGLMRSCRLLVNFPPLALLAVPAHGCHVPAHTFPDKTRRHHASGGTYARVSHALNGVEY